MFKGVKLGTVDMVPDKSARGFDPTQSGNVTVFVVNRQGHFYAYRDVCPHYGDTTLPWKKHAYLDSQGKHIVCAAHRAIFTIDTGECLSGPCRGAYLKPVPLEVRKGNELWIDVAEFEEKVI